MKVNLQYYGGRGASGGSVSASGAYSAASENYTVDYEANRRGQITKTDAGQVYKAVKNGDIEAKPELVKDLYNQVNADYRFASERYTQDYKYYDQVEMLTHSLLNSDYSTAQMLVNEIERDNIQKAGKKSPWYKYK